MKSSKKQNTFPDQQQDAAHELKRIKKKCSCGACEPPPPKLPKGMRRLKIQGKFVQRSRHYSYNPSILLTGDWLRKAGFECEDHVIIVEEPGRLIIELDKV